MLCFSRQGRFGLLFIASLAFGQKFAAERIWTDKELHDWAIPVAGLNTRPGHYSEAEYYAAAEGEWLRTFPVYFPGHEPEGYWDSLQHRKPEPLVSAGRRTRAEWKEAGRTAFRELDVYGLRTYDTDLIEVVRSADAFRKVGGTAQADGIVAHLRWVVTSKGVALSFQDCSGCHTRLLPDGSYLDGAPLNIRGNGVIGQLIARGHAKAAGGEPPGLANWRAFGVPWIPNDVHSELRQMPDKELTTLLRSNILGTFARFNGSPYFPTKIPDLNGIADARYIDHTATHRMRGVGDIARYAALVTCCDNAEFGTHKMHAEKQRFIGIRYPDELLFALATYISSLQPPPSPHRSDSRVAGGETIFRKQGCPTCHTPPLYTNNKLTLASGFVPPPDHPLSKEIVRVTVGTDPSLALKTRKGTGLYKVPSLRGVWYRGLYGHDGSVASLEDWFDPARLRDDYVPTGFKGYGVKSRKVPGHEFGLKLSNEEKSALIAFLRSL